MIILKKDNHYEHTKDTDKASKMLENGYEIVKGKTLLSNDKKQLKTKKKPSKKK